MSQFADRDEVERLVGEGATLVDARDPVDFQRCHLPGAANLPPRMLEPDTVGEALPAGGVVVAYGEDARDDRPARLAARLRTIGWTDARVYPGGLADWLAGGAITAGSDPPASLAPHLVPVPRCSLTATVAEVRPLLEGARPVAVTTAEGVVIAKVAVRSLETADPGDLVADHLLEGPLTIRADARPESVMAGLSRSGSRDVFVTTPQGVLLGLVTRHDLAAAGVDATAVPGP